MKKIKLEAWRPKYRGPISFYLEGTSPDDLDANVRLPEFDIEREVPEPEASITLTMSALLKALRESQRRGSSAEAIAFNLTSERE